MSLATLAVDQILQVPFPSYHKPFDLAKTFIRSGNKSDQQKAIELLEGLMKRFPHVLAIGQELVLALMECDNYDRAERGLNQLENEFISLDEETMSRWGRLFKDRGDQYIRLP